MLLLFLAMRLKLKKRQDLTTAGTIRMHPRGFGFLVPDDRKAFPQDIFIPQRYTLGAVDGDRVEVCVRSDYVSPKGPEGKITKILKRGRSHVAGVITYAGKQNQLFAFAPLLGEENIINILPSKERQLNVGDRIIIHVKEWGSHKKESLGEMSAYIGHISDPSLDIAAAVEEYELYDSFSENTLEEARSFGQTVSTKDFKNREDLRDLNCLTIDPETAKDFDDALSLTRDKKGMYHLGVHIADVSHYVKPGSYLDREATQRCNSVYFPGQVFPMLPHELSSHLCSLKPNVNRLAISVLMVLDKEGSIVSHKITKSVIRSKKRLSYEQAKEILDKKRKSKFLNELNSLVELCHLLKKKRAQRGCIEFALPDISMKLTEKGEVAKIDFVEYDITHQLVEEFMLLANEVVATSLSQKGKPLTYRIHDEPNPESLRDFASIASSFGFNLSKDPTNEELQNLFDEVRQHPLGQFLATCFIKSMKLASYSTQNIGHYGLGLEYYTHFTSPIRRYIDLVVHRVLFDEVDQNQDLEKIAIACSEQERLSAKAEQSVLYLKKLRYLDTLLSDKKNLFEASVVSIKPFGIIFELKEILFEGLIPMHSSHDYKVGDKLKVKLLDVDLVSRRTEWTLNSPLPKTQKKKFRRR